MGSDVVTIGTKTIEAAEGGCRESLSVITEQAKTRIFTYLYRMTLDYHVSEDLCQETLLNLVQSIRRLHFESEEALWAWLFRTAQGKVLHHRRAQSSRGISSRPFIEEAAGEAAEPIAGLFRRETMEAVFHAMEALRVEYRSVIVLRCMNELSYRQIAAVLGGTQLRNKMLFFHAKRALRQELARRGLGRAHFLGALVAYASVTSLRSQGASAGPLVHAGMLKVSVPGLVLSAMTTKGGMIAAVLVLILGLVTGRAATRKPHDPHEVIPARYASVAPLLTDDRFAYPSSILSTRDPAGRGFAALDPSRSHSTPFASSCDDVLVGRSHPRGHRLILCEGQAIELGFDGPILDGPGPDLFFTGWYCPIIRVLLTDGAGRTYGLPIPICKGDCDCFHIIPFDLSGLALPFEPRGIMVQGLGSWYRYGGFELISVRARTRDTQQ